MTAPTIEVCGACGSATRSRRRALFDPALGRYRCTDPWHAGLGAGYQRPAELVEADRGPAGARVAR